MINYGTVNTVSAKKLQVINLNQINLEVNGTYKKVENLTTILKVLFDEDVVDKTYSDTKIDELNVYKMFIEKDCIENILRSDIEAKQSGDILIENAVKTRLQILYDRGLFKRCDSTDDVKKLLSIF